MENGKAKITGLHQPPVSAKGDPRGTVTGLSAKKSGLANSAGKKTLKAKTK